jgi:hypothetical protein
MKRIVSILIGIVVTGFAAHAQVEHGGEVTLLEFDGKTALFAAEGISAKKGDILRSAEETIFDRLMYSGVEGINDGRPLVGKTREELKTKDYAVNFFKKRMHAYLKQDASGKNVLSEPLGQAVTVPGGYSCVYLIPIKYNVLIRDLKTEGLLNQ